MKFNFTDQMIRVSKYIYFRAYVLSGLFTVLSVVKGFGQLARTMPENKDSMQVVDNEHIYKMQELNDSALSMIDLSTFIPYVKFDLRYASQNNFTGKIMYKGAVTTTYLRRFPALALRDIAKDLKSRNLGILVFDAYRPYSVTVDFWNLIHDERYVANPRIGSGHNRGLAIDLTLYSLDSGQPLDMGTGFDCFNDSAHVSYALLDTNQLNNRRLLQSVMIKHGFRNLESEWWHFSWPNNRAYPVLDIGLDKAAAIFSGKK